MSSNIGTEAAIEDSVFLWLLCLNHNVLRTVYSLTINLLGCVWFGLGIQFCISNTCGGVWSTRVGKNKETDKELDENCVEFSFLLKLNSHRPYTFTSPVQETLKQNHRASHNCHCVRTHVLAFKWPLHGMIRSNVNLVICLN